MERHGAEAFNDAIFGGHPDHRTPGSTFACGREPGPSVPDQLRHSNAGGQITARALKIKNILILQDRLEPIHIPGLDILMEHHDLVAPDGHVQNECVDILTGFLAGHEQKQQVQHLIAHPQPGRRAWPARSWRRGWGSWGLVWQRSFPGQSPCAEGGGLAGQAQHDRNSACKGVGRTGDGSSTIGQRRSNRS